MGGGRRCKQLTVPEENIRPKCTVEKTQLALMEGGEKNAISSLSSQEKILVPKCTAGNTKGE